MRVLKISLSLQCSPDSGGALLVFESILGANVNHSMLPLLSMLIVLPVW